MRGKYRYLRYSVVIILIGIVMLLGCSKKIRSDSIFTEEIYNNLTEIDCWFNDDKIVINNKEDINSIYDNLSSLILTEFLTDKHVDGGTYIQLVTKDKTIYLGLLSKEISVNGKRYHTNKDITNSIRNIALKNADLYNNDVFTKDLFENLIEIDCWLEDEKVVIDNKENMQDFYYYLSKLKLEEASPEYKMISEPMKIDLVTSDKTISIGLLPKALYTSDKMYYTNSRRDLAGLGRMLAEENKR